MIADQKSLTEKLMNQLLEVAEKLLIEHGEFHPFAGYLLDDGSVTQVGLNMHGEFDVSGKERARQVEKALRSVANSLAPAAVGIVTNVSVPSADGATYDAIEIDLEHRGGYCAEVFFGYEIHGEANRALNFTATTAQAGQAGRFFGV
jgi:hypothetical protein